MKESKAVYVTKQDLKVGLNNEFQINPNKSIRDRELSPDPVRYDQDTQEVGCQYDSKRDNLICTCKNLATLKKRQEVRYFGLPKQIYAYHRSRSFTDIGVGSVKALQRKKVKKIYLPETDDRGVGSSDLSSFILRRNRQHRVNSYYENKRTSSKCVGGILEYNTGCVMNEKLSPIIQTTSGSTSPKESKLNRNIEIGSNPVVKSLATITTQVEDTPKPENTIKPEVKIEEIKPVLIVQEDIKDMRSKTADTNKLTERNSKEPAQDFSSDSLVQHVHNLENPSDDKQSQFSQETEDPMENKLEREYRRIFAAKSKSKDARSSSDKPMPDLKSTSTLKRRFEALRRGLTKKEDSKRNSIIVNKASSQNSAPSRKDVSINSDPPSLEGRSFSNTKTYKPFTPSYSRDRSMYNPRLSHYRRSVPSKHERSSAQWSSRADDDDSECQGVKGMFKLWGKKFNLDEDHYKRRPTPKPSYAPSRVSSEKKSVESPVVIKSEEEEENKMEEKREEKKEGRKFFFFKKKHKDKAEKPYKAKKGVTAGRCEVKDGLVIKIGGVANTYAPEKIVKEPEIEPENYEGIVRNAWLKKYLSQAIESRQSVQVRWNNETYAPSSSTVFELMDNVYKDTGIIFRSKSQVTVHSSYKSYTKHHVNFMHHNIEAWMIPKTLTDRPKLLPVKLKSKSNEERKENMEVRISDQKWFIDKSKAFSHKIEVVLHSKNFRKLHKEESSEYLRIDIPKGFFVNSTNSDDYNNRPTNNSSDEEVYKIVEYETGSDLKDLKKDKTTHSFDIGDHKPNNIKVTVSVKESKDCDLKILETMIKTPPVHRDVVIQGSNVYIPKRCDVIGVGIITQRDLRDIRKPILKIEDDFSDDESEHNMLRSNQKKCEFAESYLQEYYRHWTPLGIDLYSWCVSDSRLRCCSETSRASFNNQGDGSKSCPNIFDDFQASTIVSSCETSSCSHCHVHENPDKKNEKCTWFGKFKKKDSNKRDSNKRVLPKDSIEVFKRRKIYAASDKAKWVGTCPGYEPPYCVPSNESRGAGQNTLVECPKLMKSCCKPVETRPKKRTCKKHVSLPDCDTMNEMLAKQLTDSLPEGILAFKGQSGCEQCKKKGTCPKHAKVNPRPSCEIPRAPCRDSCEQMKKPPCSASKVSCEKPPSCPPTPPPCRRPPSCPPTPPPCKKPPSCPPSPPPCQKPRSCPATPPSCPPSPPPCKRSPTCPPSPPPCKKPPSCPPSPPPCKRSPTCPPSPPPCRKPPSCPPSPPPCKKPPPCPPSPPPCRKPPSCPPSPPPCKKPPPCPPSPPPCKKRPPCPSPPPCRSPTCPPSPPPCKKSPPPCKRKPSPPPPCPPSPPPKRKPAPCNTPPCKKPSLCSTPPCRKPSPPCAPSPPPCQKPRPPTPPCRKPPPCPPSPPPCKKPPRCPHSPPSCPHVPPCPPSPPSCPHVPPCPPSPPSCPPTPPPCKKPPRCPHSPPSCPHVPPCPPSPPPPRCPYSPPPCPYSPPRCPHSPPPPPCPHSPPPCPYTPPPCYHPPPPPCRPKPPSCPHTPPCTPPPPSCYYMGKPCPAAPPSCPASPPSCCSMDPNQCPAIPPPCKKGSNIGKKFSPKFFKKKTCPGSPPCKPSPCKKDYCKKLSCQPSPCEFVPPRSPSPCKKFSTTSCSYGSLKTPDAPYHYSPIHPCPQDREKKSSPCDTPPCCLQHSNNKPPQLEIQDSQEQIPNDFPWPTKNQVSNQSSVTSLFQAIDAGKCKKSCPLMPKLSCESIPSPKKDCKTSCPNKQGSPPPPCLPEMQCPPPKPPAEPVRSPLPDEPKYKQSKPKMSGLYLKMNPGKKNKTCSKDCLAWDNYHEDGCISLNSEEKITIRLKKETPSTEEIREGLNIKVQDEDGMTLFERKDYRLHHAGMDRPSLLGDMYKASEVRRVTTNNSVQAIIDKDCRKEIADGKSEASIANLIEIQFKLKVTQGEKTTEINIANDGDKESEIVEKNDKEPINKIPQEVFVMKEKGERPANEHTDQKNDINIRIVIKNFKPKSGKKKSVNVKRDDYSKDFSQKISAKFHTVSTGYSDVLHDDNVFSVHRATVDLTSSIDKSKTHSNKSEEIMSEALTDQGRRILIGSSEPSICKCTTDMSEGKSEDAELKSALSHKYSVRDGQDNLEETDTENKTDHKYEYTEETDNERTMKYDTEGTDTDKQVEPKYDTEETDTDKRPKYDTFMSTDTEPDTIPEHETYNKSKSIEVIVKPHTKDEKKEMLKQVFEKAHETKTKSKNRMRKLRDMLKVILTSDSSDHDDAKLVNNDLAKDVTYASLKPNYFRDSDSMNNYYRAESNAAISEGEINRKVVYPTEENNSECSNSNASDVLSSENESPARGCMCSTVAARLKMASRIGEGGGCCCSKKSTKKNEETCCDLNKDSDYCQFDYKQTEYVDVQTQNSRYLTSKINSTNLSIHRSMRSSILDDISIKNDVKADSGVINVDDRHYTAMRRPFSPQVNHMRECSLKKLNRNTILSISDEDKIVLLSDKQIRVSADCNKTKDKEKKTNNPMNMLRASDILQSYETKKAVLEIYTEKTISDDGEHLVAKLPKFVYDRENEIQMNYEAMATNTYKAVCKRNIVMMAINR